jgi:hypothetical protein
MGLKGYRLWVMGQLDSTCRAPPPVPGLAPRPASRGPGELRDVVVQVEFERRLESRRAQAKGLMRNRTEKNERGELKRAS